MTMRKVPGGGLWVPYPISFRNAIPEISDSLPLSIDEEYTKAAFTFVCPSSGELDMFEFYCNVNTADPATTLKCSFQDLDADDFPDGMADYYRIITINDFPSAWIQPGIISSDGTDTGTKKTVVRGQKIACVVEFQTSDPADVMYLGAVPLSYDTVRRSNMGSCLHNSGGWSRDVSNMAVATLKYEENPVYRPTSNALPITGFNTIEINTGTTPDEVGMEFAFPTPTRIGGASVCLSSATGTSWDCVVYDSSNTAIETVPMKIHTGLFPANGYTYWTARFSSDIFVGGNEIHRITVKPSSATTIRLLGIVYSDSVMLSDLHGYIDTGEGEVLWITCKRTDGGTFSQDPTIPLISINVTGIDMDAGGATNDWTGDA
jgi:hypothetical protein